MSGAFVGQELESEFGKIPPSFLPLGNKRLFQHQIKLAPEDVDIFISNRFAGGSEKSSVNKIAESDNNNYENDNENNFF